jgi:hypothetical protein
MPTATQPKRKASTRRKAKPVSAQERFLARIDNAALVASSKDSGTHRSRWSPDDDRIVLNDRLGLPEMARLTRRSYNAVASRRSYLLRQREQQSA